RVGQAGPVRESPPARRRRPVRRGSRGGRSWLAGRRLADAFELGEVVLFARAHEEVLLLPAVALLRALHDPPVVNRNLARADHFELLAANDDRRALVEADAEHVRVPGHDFFEI